jgi:hypothetical protein
MLRLILPIVLLLLGLGAGVGAGLFFGQPAPSETGSTDAPPTETEGSPEVAAPDPGSQTGPAASGGTEYVRLNNQFIVPIVRNSAVRSLVVMSLTVEVNLGNTQTVFGQEPRLRDSFLQVMFAHANAGGFDGSFTQAIAMDPLRAGLRDAARQVLGDIVKDVLIVDITRQDA